ncbi:MAG: S9 family peptidase [Proteobacteria bacterium]|nr:S9 family peptidase [Pseudomonadota bacterium]
MTQLARCFPVVVLLGCGVASGEEPRDVERTVREVLEVPQVDEPRIAPDGSAVAYTVETPDWKANRYDTEIFVARSGQPARQITANAAGSSWAPRWSPDGKSVAYLADGDDGSQIYLSPADGGPPRKLTAIAATVISFEWSPDGHAIALTVPEAPPARIAARDNSYGSFSVLREAAPAANLWLLDVGRTLARNTPADGSNDSLRRLTGGPGMCVVIFSTHSRNNFTFSPDSRTIAFTYAADLNIMDAIRADIATVDVQSGEIHRLVQTPDYWEDSPVFSPDGRRILYSRLYMKDFLRDTQLLTVPVSGGEPTVLAPRYATGAPLGDPSIIGWTSRGIDVFVEDGVRRHIARIEPTSGKVGEAVGKPDAIIAADVSANGREWAVTATDGSSATDLYRVTASDSRSSRPAHGRPGAAGGPQRIAAASNAISGWPAINVQTIRWKAADGVDIEGVLYTPSHLDRPAPLVVLLHGGPREVARPARVHAELFPVEQWLREGAVVLFPNYRGSIGYGERFRRLTTLNIGHAESLDIESAVQHLAGQGLIDPRHVGVAGHSWGGYLSAFMATTSRTFQAALVAAGITDNTVNYVMSNAGAGEGGYLDSLPWKKPELWARTSAITFVSKAQTPTLIQHGESDVVVPVANALILDRGLLDMKVPVRTVIYHETGHNHFKPRERLSANLENWRWFERYLWGRDVKLPWED